MAPRGKTFSESAGVSYPFDQAGRAYGRCFLHAAVGSANRRRTANEWRSV